MWEKKVLTFCEGDSRGKTIGVAPVLVFLLHPPLFWYNVSKITGPFTQDADSTVQSDLQTSQWSLFRKRYTKAR